MKIFQWYDEMKPVTWVPGKARVFRGRARRRHAEPLPWLR